MSFIAVKTLITVIGLFTIIKTFISLLILIFNLFLKKGIQLSKFGAGSGSTWAVVSGASDGIGKEFALQLAQAKFNVVLLARTETKLNTLAKQIRESCNVETKVIVFDFNTDNTADYTRLAMQLHGLDITVLVNNVGTNHDFPVAFTDENIDTVTRIVNVNIQSVLKLTHMLTPRMIEHRRGGLILNVGSMAGLFPQPLLSVYSGSKSFLSSWTQALGKELQPFNITVQCLDTYFVVSNMSKISKPSMVIPTARTFVKACLAKLGVQCGSELPYSSSPYYVHAGLGWLVRQFVHPYILLQYAFYIQSSIRKRALRKFQRLNNNVQKVQEVKKEE